MDRAEELFSRLEVGGIAELRNLISTGNAEELFLDYKRSADNGSGTSLHNTDRANLGKAISGFANSEGGIIVWGVDCRKDAAGADLPSDNFPVVDANKFRTWLDGAVSGLTIPVHDGVRSIPITYEGEAAGFVVTYIPKGKSPPYQVNKDSRYMMRAGSNFVPVPHAVLAGLFGRRPAPSVHMTFVLPRPVRENGGIKTQLGVVLYNSGPGIAADLFAKAAFGSAAGPACEMKMVPPEDNIWAVYTAFSEQAWLMSRPEVRVPPEGMLMPFAITMFIKPPFTGNFKFLLSCGCSGSPSFSMTFDRDALTVAQSYDFFMQNHGSDQKEIISRFNKTFYGEKLF